MAKVMLISPPEKLVLSEAGDRPNLGLLYLASSLKKNGHHVEISDLNHDSYIVLNQRIKTLSPDYIGMTAVSAYSRWIKDHASYLRQRFPKVQLIAGGPHATGLPEDLTKHFDYIVQGEGEEAIVNIVEKKTNKGIIKAPFVKDLEKLPNPARNLLPLNIHRYGIERSFGQKGTLMDTSRGCVGTCFYCTKFLRGRGQRFYSLEKTLEQMEEIRDAGFDWVYFTDDCFTSDRERTLKLMKGMRKRNINLKFETMTRTDCVDTNLLEEMQKSGLECLLYGIEHVDDKVLSLSGKRCNTKSHKKGIAIAKDLGIKTMGTFILNLPGATEKTMYDCLDFAKGEGRGKGLGLDFARFFGLQAYPGTPLWNNPERYGYIITSKNISSPLSSEGETNVESENMPKEKAEEIIADIREKWNKYKNTETPWI